MELITLLLKAILIVIFFASIRWIYHLFMLVISKEYKEKVKQIMKIKKKNSNKIDEIENIEDKSVFMDTIYDAYLIDFEILNFQKFKSELDDFDNEKNIVNIIYDSFLTKRLWDLESALHEFNKKNIERESVLTYLRVIEEIKKDKDKINVDAENFEVKFRKIIQSKLLKTRKNYLETSIENSRINILESLELFKNQNDIKEENFRLDNIVDKLDSKEGYKAFFKKFLNEFNDLEKDIKNIIKYEIIDKYDYKLEKELKLQE